MNRTSLAATSVFNWTATGFVRRTKTNGPPGRGNFGDVVVSLRRVNPKAKSQVVRVVRMCVVVSTSKGLRGKGNKGW